MVAIGAIVGARAVSDLSPHSHSSCCSELVAFALAHVEL